MMKLIIVSFLATVFLVQYSESVPVYQVLPPKEGYVPVYIRLGNTPLNQINAELAAAFHENEVSPKLDEEMLKDRHSSSSSESNSTEELRNVLRSHGIVGHGGHTRHSSRKHGYGQPHSHHVPVAYPVGGHEHAVTQGTAQYNFL